ncbi:MAG: transcription antitermination factor NusB [Eubacterium sp.]|nr:transcription antitermination factor NusB [Eubacterium sp.]
MNRTTLRKHNFKLLFETEFHPPERLEEQFDLYVNGLGFTGDESADPESVSEEDIEYMRRKFFGVVEALDDIDDRINEVAEGWTTSRMGKVELSILRLAYYEIKYEDDIPVAVAINEAVELAKTFGSDGSPSFVNGILAKLV